MQKSVEGSQENCRPPPLSINSLKSSPLSSNSRRKTVGSRRRPSDRDGPRRFSMYTESNMLIPEHPSPLDPEQVGQALCVAAWRGNLSMVTSLVLKKKADLNYVDDQGWGALHWAALAGHGKVCEYLCSQGSSVNKADLRKKRTPLHVASAQGHASTVQCLAGLGADLNCRDHQERTPLWVACHQGDVRVVRQLLLLGASGKTPDVFGREPGIIFAFTVSRTRRRWVRELLEAKGKMSGLEYQSWWSLICCFRHKVFIYLEDPSTKQPTAKEKIDILTKDDHKQPPQRKKSINFFISQQTVNTVKRAVHTPLPKEETSEQGPPGKYQYLRKFGLEDQIVPTHNQGMCQVCDTILKQVGHLFREVKRAQIEVFKPELLKWCKMLLQLSQIVMKKLKGLNGLENTVVEKMLECSSEEIEEFAKRIKYYQKRSLLIGFVSSPECMCLQYEIVRQFEAILSIQNDGLDKTRDSMPEFFSDDSLIVQSVKSEDDDYTEDHSIQSHEIPQSARCKSNNHFDDHRKNSIPEEVAGDPNPASSSSTENDHSSVKDPTIDFEDPMVSGHNIVGTKESPGKATGKQLFETSSSSSHLEKDAIKKRENTPASSNQFASKELKMVSIP